MTLLLSISTAQFSQGTGFRQEVTVDVDRGEKTTSERVELYCLQENLTFCDDNPGILEILFVMFNMEDFGEKHLGESGEEARIQTISTPTKP